jgi:hypothetical protein
MIDFNSIDALRNTLPERRFRVVKIHVTKSLTREEAYTMALRLRQQGYGSEIVTDEDWPDSNYSQPMQDLTPFKPKGN